ncbi:MAG: hypothetical protein ACRD1S_11410, partial [Vicinamibacterales bacterium]
MKIGRLFTLVLLFIAVTAVAVPAGQTGDSLYKRIGGYDAIAAVTDDFIGRLGADPQISRFFAGHGTDSKKKLRQHVIDLVC